MHTRDTGWLRVDTRCEPLVTALLVRDAAQLTVHGLLIPGRLDLPSISAPPAGGAASEVGQDEWVRWWSQLVQSISAGDLTTAYTGASPTLIRLIDSLSELDGTVLREWEAERADATEAFARLAEVCTEMTSDWHGQSSVSVCVLPVVDEEPLSTRGVILLPLSVLWSSSNAQLRRLISDNLGSE